MLSEHVFLQVFSDAFCLTQGVLSGPMPCTQLLKPFGQRLISLVVQSMTHLVTIQEQMEQSNNGMVMLTLTEVWLGYV